MFCFVSTFLSAVCAGFRSWLRTGFTLALCLGLVGCGERKPPDNVLLRGISTNPDTVDPHKAEGSWENAIIGDMLIGLFTDAQDGSPTPGAATSWTVSDNGLRWVFKLRPMQWSDGVQVTAYDFEYAMRRLMNPQTIGAKYASLLYVLKNAQSVNSGEMPLEALGVRAIDPLTLQLDLEYPAPYLPGLLKHYVAWPVPRHVVEAHGDNWTKPENIVVNGPYKLKSWRTGDFLHSVRNPLFYDTQNVCFDEVYYYPYADAEAVIRLTRTGRIDLNNNFPGHRLEELKKILPGWPRLNNALSISYIVFNSRHAPFQDVQVRQALSLSIDREFIVEEILKIGRVAKAFVPPGVINYGEHLDALPQAPYVGLSRAQRLEKARTLLSAAGFGPERPLEFELLYLSTGNHGQITPVIQSNWSEIADWVKPAIRRVDTRVLYNQLQEGDFQASTAGWIADYNDAQNFLYLMQSSTGSMNYGAYFNPEFDQILDQANHERDMKKRAKLLSYAEKLILHDTPVTPVTASLGRHLVNPELTGWTGNGESIHRSRYMCRQKTPE